MATPGLILCKSAEGTPHRSGSNSLHSPQSLYISRASCSASSFRTSTGDAFANSTEC